MGEVLLFPSYTSQRMARVHQLHFLDIHLDFHGYPSGYAYGNPSSHYLQLMVQVGFFYFSGARTSLRFLTESRKIVDASLGAEVCLFVQVIRIPKTAQLGKDKD